MPTQPCTLAEPRVSAALIRMFGAATRDDETAARLWSIPLDDRASLSAQELADAAQEIYMPVSADGGKLLYNLIRATRPTNVVEFGTSYGISTLHLAAAVRDNGTGQVITTEMNRIKAASARDTFTATGLDDVITVLEGNALETLAALRQPVGFLFLDGWKNLCLPVLRLLEPHIAPGTLVVADDVDLPGLGPYLDHVRDTANGYHSVTFPVEDGLEISCRL
ncbi:class I SAM-dependent methyltransferase [Streptomyces sp. NBC_00654]|uniref:O-methyltransferase n=1 Tax=Streptomyces sp. NBC_00654 TaxID=2975799 RepID=UPI002251BD0A|nr:class I SAM-dependent methyltransferase [Streptomyces sp. NBC_00654]MCX4963606.1 class I SAM-dependent methyltransferase [Streptomyces sp. NBC_00654]